MAQPTPIFRHWVDPVTDKFDAATLLADRWLNTGSKPYSTAGGKLTVTVGAGADDARLELRVALPRSTAVQGTF